MTTDQSRFKTLISATDLTRLTAAAADILVIDCRARLGEVDWGPRAFQEGHLPDAIHLNLDTDLAAEPGAGGRHPLPAAETLAATLRDAGANDTTQLVCYDDAGGAFAARAWWCLRWLGHPAAAVLDGGLSAWLAQPDAPALHGGPVAVRPPGNFSVRPPLTRQIDAPTLLQRLSGPALTLIDARSEARFAGREEPIDPVAGHIPGAQCRPFQLNLTADGLFRAPADLAAEFESLGSEPILYCGSGVTAAHNALALVHAGAPEPQLYPGSWSEWIVDPNRPRLP